MKRSPLHDPYRAVVQRFNQRGVRYVVVGMSGINYYSKDPSETFATLDYDIFLDASQENLRKALQSLEGLGFTIGTKVGALKPVKNLKPDDLKQWIRRRSTLVATTTEGFMVELLLEISGYPFSEMARDAKTFTVRGVPILVGRLTKLLRSKQVAGRLKDRRFLRRYRSLLEEDV